MLLTFARCLGLTLLLGSAAYPGASEGSEGATKARQGGAAEARSIHLPDSGITIELWSEVAQDGSRTPFYSIQGLGPGRDTVRVARHDIMLRGGVFDPLLEGTGRAADPVPTSEGVYIVQFETQALEVYRAELRRIGVRIERFLAHQGYLVRMDTEQAGRVDELEYVRWVGRYAARDRIEPALGGHLAPGSPSVALPCVIQVFDRGMEDKSRVAETIAARGGFVEDLYPQSLFFRATIPSASLLEIAGLEQVLWIDRDGDPIPTMNIARMIGGADHIENTLGFTGAGVRGEVLDFGCRVTHQEFQVNPLILHKTVPIGFHGTPTTSEIFSSGVDPKARGLLPDGQGIVAELTFIGDPYIHRQELVDPNGPFRASFQSNSWGYAPLTMDYTNRTTEVDDLVVQTGLLHVWGQGNNGDQVSLQEAWAKNIVSVGGFNHNNTLSTADDMWAMTGSIGPAADGRIKPDLTGFYDKIYTANNNGDTNYNAAFGGTSGATPIIAGHHGLFLEMWHRGVFGNDPGGTTVFESRPRWTTAKAVIVNTATPFDFTGPGHDFERFHQGWGRPDLVRLYDRRERMLIVNETDALQNLESTSYEVHVNDPQESLRATLVYEDVPGTTSSSVHRVNDLSLKLTSPTGVIYWGNQGLTLANASSPGGTANTVDTVENVFVESPELGAWTVEVIATEVNADSRPETPAVDADYALVVSGFACETPQTYCAAAPGLLCGLPSISTTGIPSATASSGYTISAGPARGQSAGILLYSNVGAQATPFLGGTLCVLPPLRRSAVVNSGGTAGACDGQYSIDRNAFAQGLLGGNPATYLTTRGTTVYSQWWGRDTSAGGSFLSDAVIEVICD